MLLEAKKDRHRASKDQPGPSILKPALLLQTFFFALTLGTNQE